MSATQTYAESVGDERFDWKTWLETAIVSQPSRFQRGEAQELARDWVTCACGNQCSIIPRHPGGQPRDEILFQMGADFEGLIRRGEWREALTLLHRIEARAAELIADIKAKKHE